jgi:hypothetical protein
MGGHYTSGQPPETIVMGKARKHQRGTEATLRWDGVRPLGGPQASTEGGMDM